MKSRALGTAAVAGIAGLVGTRAVLRQAALATKTRTDPDLDPLLEMPRDVHHHYVGTPDGGRIHVVERGEGRSLLFVHGVSLQAGIWAPQFHQLADSYRLLAVDVRGHGLSEAGADGYGRDVAAQDVAAVVEHFDLRDAVVVGHSMGGMIVMQLIANAPRLFEERVAGVVFMDTAAYQVVPDVVKPAVGRVGQRLLARVESGRHAPGLGGGGDDFSWMAARLAFGTSPSGAAVGLVRKYVEDTPDAAGIPCWVDLMSHDARVGLAAYRGPALVVVGALDLLTPVWAAKRIARLLPQSRLEIIHGAGHQPMMERPYEVADILEEFVAGLAARTG